MANHAGKRTRQPYVVGEPSVEIRQAEGWTTEEDLMIINGSPDESDSEVSAIEMHKRMPHHPLTAVATRYYQLKRTSMTQHDISRLWHMWLT